MHPTYKVLEKNPMITYGDKPCLYCSLTVAEYVNGRVYSLPEAGFGYLHDGCKPTNPTVLLEKGGE